MALTQVVYQPVWIGTTIFPYSPSPPPLARGGAVLKLTQSAISGWTLIFQAAEGIVFKSGVKNEKVVFTYSYRWGPIEQGEPAMTIFL